MNFKKVVLLSGLSLLTGFIVVPSGSPVNQNKTKNTTRQTEIADGMPLPPLPPGKSTVFTADGMPLPPDHATQLVADRMPLPPLPPDKVVELFADGMPLPPLPPAKASLVEQAG